MRDVSGINNNSSRLTRNFSSARSITFLPQLLRGIVFNLKMQIHDVVSILPPETDVHMRDNIIFSSENKRSDLIAHKVHEGYEFSLC